MRMITVGKSGFIGTPSVDKIVLDFLLGDSDYQGCDSFIDYRGYRDVFVD